MTTNNPESLSLEDERKELVRSRIVRAALTGLSDVGLDVRVEDIAELAGVGRRTIFRYFATREEMLIEALESAIRNYLDHIPARNEKPVGSWLDEVARAATEVNATYGLGYWQLVLKTDVDGPFGEALAARRERRQAWSREIADEAWTAAGGPGSPPAWLVSAFIVGLGPFTTAGFQIDAQVDVVEGARLAGLLLRSLLTTALAESKDQPSKR